jgi:hypothetical protein
MCFKRSYVSVYFCLCRHVPTGVLFDLLCAEPERPWNLTVRILLWLESCYCQEFRKKRKEFFYVNFFFVNVINHNVREINHCFVSIFKNTHLTLVEVVPYRLIFLTLAYFYILQEVSLFLTNLQSNVS